MEDRYVYERGLLRHMLTLRTSEGLSVVCAETLLREFVDDLGAGMQTYDGDPAAIAAWAIGQDDGMGSEPQRLCCKIDCAYRIMVGAFPVTYQPDWLCVVPAARPGHPRFKAWDPARSAGGVSESLRRAEPSHGIAGAGRKMIASENA